METRNIDVGIFFSSLDTSPCPHRITAYLESPLSQLSAFHIHQVLYHFPYRISAFHLNTLFYYFPGQYDYTWAYHGKVGVLKVFSFMGKLSQYQSILCRFKACLWQMKNWRCLFKSYWCCCWCWWWCWCRGKRWRWLTAFSNSGDGLELLRHNLETA